MARRNSDVQVLNLEIATPDLDTPEPELDDQLTGDHVDGHSYYDRGRNRSQTQGQNQSRQARNTTATTTETLVTGAENSNGNGTTPASQNGAQSGQEGTSNESGPTQAAGDQSAGTSGEGEQRRQLPTITEIMEVQRQRVRERRTGERTSDRREQERESTSRLLRDKGILPILPLCYAALCAILNFILPGSGTCCSTCGICCCNMADIDPRRRRRRQPKCTLVMINLLVASCQLVLIPFLLIGWVWSCIWGCMYIKLAEEYETKTRERRELIQRMRNPGGEVPEPPAYSQEVEGDQLPIYGYNLPVPTSPPPPYEGPPASAGGTTRTQHSGETTTTVVTEQPQPVSTATVTVVQETEPRNNRRATNSHVTTLRNTYVAANFFRSQNPYTRPVRSGSQNGGDSLTPVS